MGSGGCVVGTKDFVHFIKGVTIEIGALFILD